MVNESNSLKLEDLILQIKSIVTQVGITTFLGRTTVSRPELWRILNRKSIPRSDTLFELLEAAQIELTAK